MTRITKLLLLLVMPGSLRLSHWQCPSPRMRPRSQHSHSCLCLTYSNFRHSIPSRDDADLSPWEDEGETVTLTSYHATRVQQTANLVDFDGNIVSWRRMRVSDASWLICMQGGSNPRRPVQVSVSAIYTYEFCLIHGSYIYEQLFVSLHWYISNSYCVM